MIQLANRTVDGELMTYVRNFERWVIEQCKGKRGSNTIEGVYEDCITEFGGRWEPNGFVFERDEDAAMFLLRWS